MSLLKKSGTTLIAIIAKQLTSHASELVEMPFTISPSLDYEEAQQNIRATLKESKRHVKDHNDVADAFVAWNRTALKWDDGGYDRGVTPECGGLGKGAFANFDMNFKLFSSSTMTTEQFEIAYITKTIFTELETLAVTFKSCNGDCQMIYGLTWSELESFELNKTDNHYSSLSWSVNISGSFMSLLTDKDMLASNAVAKPILEIIFDTEIRDLTIG